MSQLSSFSPIFRYWCSPKLLIHSYWFPIIRVIIRCNETLYIVVLFLLLNKINKFNIGSKNNHQNKISKTCLQYLNGFYNGIYLLFENFSILISLEDCSTSHFICLITMSFLYKEIVSYSYIFFSLILPISTFVLIAILLVSHGARFLERNLHLFASILLGRCRLSKIASFKKLGFLKITPINLGIIWLLQYQLLNSLVPCLFRWIEGMIVFTKYFLEYHHALLLYFHFNLIGLDCFLCSFVDLLKLGIHGKLKI